MHIVRARPDGDHALAAKVLAIQRSAYAVEAQLIGDDRIPVLHETVRQLQVAPVQWLLSENEMGEPVGGVAWRSDGECVDIDRFFVSPDMHRHGIGRGLIGALLDATAESRITVTTGRENIPARALYESVGFVHVGDVEVVNQLWLARYELKR